MTVVTVVMAPTVTHLVSVFCSPGPVVGEKAGPRGASLRSASVGPLQGVKIVEFAGIGPGPFGAMVLSDLGAEVLRITRPGVPTLLAEEGADLLSAGRAELALDLKDPGAVEQALRITERADALIDPFRPGVMERNGLGPETVLARNPQLVYARMTGYGQTGPMADRAGHDINYISLAGALGGSARQGERPLFPLNLLGDFGGGGMLLALGVVSGVLHARSSGEGQVIDVAMVDGVTLLTTMIQGLRQAGMWSEVAGTNLLDSGAPFYEVYVTSDDRHIAVGALEPQFHARLLELLEIPPQEMAQWDRERWPAHRARLAETFRTRTREHWSELFAGEDACVTPVLGLHEADGHPQAQARDAFVRAPGSETRVRPAPAPRFARTPAEVPTESPSPEDLLKAWGVTPADSDTD
jgi:alpha-methylacyl-CoA racemase